MKNELFAEYVKLEAKYRDIEEQREALRAKIVEEMQKHDVVKTETDFGSFSVCEKTVWKYSEKVKTLENKVKIEKDKEQKKGIAEASVTSYLKFTKAHDEI